MPGRCSQRTWWWSEAQPCCRVSCTGCWQRYASWWRNRSTALCWQARVCAFTLHLPSPTAPPGSEVRHRLLFDSSDMRMLSKSNMSAFWRRVSKSTVCTCTLYRCYLWRTPGHLGQQVGVTGILQSDRPNPRLVLLEFPSSWISVRSRKDASSTHEESLLHREVDCVAASVKWCILHHLTEHFSNIRCNILLSCDPHRQLLMFVMCSNHIKMFMLCIGGSVSFLGGLVSDLTEHLKQRFEAVTRMFHKNCIVRISYRFFATWCSVFCLFLSLMTKALNPERAHTQSTSELCWQWEHSNWIFF